MKLPRSPILMMIAQIEEAVEFKVWQAIQGGLDMVILRAKNEDLALIKSTVSIMRTALGAKFPIMVNAGDRPPKIAQSSGFHFPEAAMKEELIVPKGKGLGISVHSAISAKRAEQLNPDYLLAGTIFATASHKGEKPGGIEHLRAICQATTVPVIAIGGITPGNAGECVKAGAIGIAALSPFKGAGREALAKAYKEAMRDFMRQ
jgi:thiamine-phosphate diphosphorylase